MTEKQIVIYTDGACKGNPGKGGWGAWLKYGEHERKLCGGEANTTNNRMEIMAVIKALEALKGASQVKLYTDSQYVKNGITQWMKNWKKNGWKTAARKPVKNSDLWKELDLATQNHQIEWLWVRGHSGNPGNEMADQLSNKGIDTKGT